MNFKKGLPRIATILIIALIFGNSSNLVCASEIKSENKIQVITPPIGVVW